MRGRHPVSCAGLALVSAALVSGCRKEGVDAPAFVTSFAAGPKAAGDAKLAYSHTLTIDVAAERLATHFGAARDRCLRDLALRCVLVESRIEQDPTGAVRPHGRIEVRLPHDAVSVYIVAVTAALPGEAAAAAAVVVRAQGTRAEDLSRPIEDGARRLGQLSDYRARLTELADRPDTKTDDLIKIAGEISRAQSEIEAADAQQRCLTERIETEALTIALESDLAAGGIWAPVRETWRRAGALLGESAGDALRFAIVALPWTPIAVGILALLRWVWRRHRGKPA